MLPSLLLLPPTTSILDPPHSIQTTSSPHNIPFVFFSHSAFFLKLLSSCYVLGTLLSPPFKASLHQFPPPALLHSALFGGFHCCYPHCTTAALLQSSRTLAFKKTSVGLKTFCNACLVEQLRRSQTLR